MGIKPIILFALLFTVLFKIVGSKFFFSVGHPYHTEGLTCLSISSDSTFAVTGSKDGSVHIVNITTGKV